MTCFRRRSNTWCWQLIYCGFWKPLLKAPSCMSFTIPCKRPIFSAVVSHIIMQIFTLASYSSTSWCSWETLSHTRIPSLISVVIFFSRTTWYSSPCTFYHQTGDNRGLCFEVFEQFGFRFLSFWVYSFPDACLNWNRHIITLFSDAYKNVMCFMCRNVVFQY